MHQEISMPAKNIKVKKPKSPNFRIKSVFGSKRMLFTKGEPKMIPLTIKPTTTDEFSFLAKNVNKKEANRHMIKVMISIVASI